MSDVFAIDVGTSSLRVSVYDERGELVEGAFAQRAHRPTLAADGTAELEPLALLQRLGEAIDEVMSRPLRRPIVGVGMSVFWHSLMGVDAGGVPLTPVYTWLDARSRAAAAMLRERLDASAIYRRTGCPLHWAYLPAKLWWLKAIDPRRFAQCARFVSLADWLREQLLGDASTSSSMASASGLCDGAAMEWHRPLLEVLELEEKRLPLIDDTRRPSLTAGAAKRWPALAAAVWLPAVGDGAASNIGAGCTTAERLAVMMGTSGAVRAVCREPYRPPPTGLWRYRVDGARSCLGGAINDAGNLFEWLRATLALPPPPELEAQLLTMAPDAHGLTVLPTWAGERSLGWALSATGAIEGLRLSTTPVEIVRAAMESVAVRLAGIAHEIVKVHSATELVASGGALLKSPAWLQMVADATGLPLIAPPPFEASSRGAALLALEGLQRLASPLEKLPAPVGKRYEPRRDVSEVYQRAAERQARLYARQRA